MPQLTLNSLWQGLSLEITLLVSLEMYPLFCLTLNHPCIAIQVKTVLVAMVTRTILESELAAIVAILTSYPQFSNIFLVMLNF